MIKILFICHGNICRSPMALYYFRRLLKERGLSGVIQADSAATSTEEIGNPVHHGTRAKLKQAGIPCGDKPRRNRKYTTLRNSKETQGRERSTHPAQGASDDKKRLFIL